MIKAVKCATRNYDFKSTYDLAEAKKLVDEAILKLRKSQTATEILTVAESSSDDVEVVCQAGGDGQFLIPNDPSLSNPLVNSLIVWDPGKPFAFFTNVKKIQPKVQYTAEKASYPPEIVLIHELGHYKQWQEGKGPYTDKLNLGDPGIAQIEADNLYRHENHVAAQLGYPLRSKYLHFPGSGWATPKRIDTKDYVKKTDWRCYITTATCRALGLGDECTELALLRWFRDHVLMADPAGVRDVTEYYATAPRVVAAIELSNSPAAIYQEIYWGSLRPACTAIRAGDFARAWALYREMVRSLDRKPGADLSWPTDR